jgi:hypothetical protein
LSKGTREVKPKTPVEVAEKFERLNSLAKTMRENHVISDITTFACYVHTMGTLAWVMGEIPDVPLEVIMEHEIESSIKDKATLAEFRKHTSKPKYKKGTCGRCGQKLNGSKHVWNGLKICENCATARDRAYQYATG